MAQEREFYEQWHDGTGGHSHITSVPTCGANVTMQWLVSVLRPKIIYGSKKKKSHTGSHFVRGFAFGLTEMEGPTLNVGSLPSGGQKMHSHPLLPSESLPTADRASSVMPNHAHRVCTQCSLCCPHPSGSLWASHCHWAVPKASHTQRGSVLLATTNTITSELYTSLYEVQN